MDAHDLVKRASGAAVATDASNRISFANAAAEKLVGCKPGSLVGKRFQDALEARDRFGNRLCQNHCALHEMIRAGEGIQAFEMDVRDAAGNHLRVATSVVVVLGQDPTDYSLVFLLSPRPRRRRADEAIDRLMSLSPGAFAVQIGDQLRGPRNGGSAPLTRRQQEILSLVAEGKSATQISKSLGISKNTVRNHTQNILHRLGAKSKAEAVSLALRHHAI